MTGMALLRVVAPAVACLALATACSGAGKREAAALVASVDRFLHASGPSTAAQAKAVSDVPCTDARVCEAKQICVAAVDPTAKAIELKDEVDQRLGEIQAAKLAPDSPEARALPAKLDDATRLLKEGHDKMQACETALADLQVAYKL
jgi:hypothetical protein